MAPSSRWYIISRRTIGVALEEARAAGLSGKELLAHVDAAYPFGTRENWPYRQWLKARRAMLGGLTRGGEPNRVPAPGGGAEVDRYHWFRVLGTGTGPAWEAFLMGQRRTIEAAELPADDMSDEDVARWTPSVPVDAGSPPA